MPGEAKGRWLIGDRLAVGAGRLCTSCGAWLSGAGEKGTDRARAVFGRTIGGGVATLFVGGTVYALGHGLLMYGGAVLLLGSAWVAGGQQPPDGTPAVDSDGGPANDPDAFARLLHTVAAGGNVHLSAVRAQLAEETGRDWDVLALCRAAGITTKQVRVPGADPAVTTGIHRTDLPPLPRPLPGGVVGPVTSNNNTNNMTREEYAEGVVIVKHGPSIRQGVTS